MKTVVTTLLLVICITTVSYSQKTYSYENLGKMTQLELNEHLVKALKQQKTGKTINKTGFIFLGVGLSGAIAAAVSSDSDVFYIGAATALFAGALGLTALAIGTPIKNSGKNKVNRINSINASRGIGAQFELKPSAQFNSLNRKYHPGLTLALSF